ncbi:MAG: hypothetical protein JNK49_18245, partial [Planctomycetes bacterium]|nr:hypothetical protein [Planctomycetota bacterium]
MRTLPLFVAATALPVLLTTAMAWPAFGLRGHWAMSALCATAGAAAAVVARQVGRQHREVANLARTLGADPTQNLAAHCAAQQQARGRQLAQVQTALQTTAAKAATVEQNGRSVASGVRDQAANLQLISAA